MKRRLICLVLASLVSACGQDRNRDNDEDNQIPVNPVPKTGDGGDYINRQIPIETFLVGGKGLPSRLKSDSLVLKFRSNILDAGFECELEQQGFRPCPGGDYYTFPKLDHGRGYRIAVRARTPQGVVDSTPIRFDFLVDQIAGEVPFSTLGEGTQFGPDSIPISTNQVANPNDPNLLANRSIQVGVATGVVIPKDLTVTSYSTTKTYSGVMRMIRLLDPHAGSAYQNIPCNESWEFTTSLADGRSYCDSRPSKDQLRRALPEHLPYDHVELVRGSGTRTDEKLLVAAFDEVLTDPTEATIGIDRACERSTNKGRSAVPILNRFWSYRPDVEIFQWCQIQDAEARHWWLGTFVAPLVDAPGAPRIRVIYSLAAGRGVISGPQFAHRAGTFMTQIVVPLMPVSGANGTPDR